VGVIHHQPCVKSLCQVGKLPKRRAVAVHGEHAFGDNQGFAVRCAVLLEQARNMASIIVPKCVHGGA
jgi:hypothetical protein